MPTPQPTLNNSNWVEWRGVTPAGTQRNNVVIAADTFDAPAWIGASVIAKQYNFTASQAFFLKKRPVKPTGATFMLCIKYRVGEEVERYRLWDDDDFVAGNDAAPLYDSEVIKANFCLEVWSLEGVDEIEQTAITLITTLRTVPVDVRSVSAVSLEPLAALDFADLQSTTVLAKSPVAGMNCWLDANDSFTIVKDGSDFVSEWGSPDPALPIMSQATGANQPKWISTGAFGAAFPYIRFNDADNVRKMVSDVAFEARSFFAVINQVTWTSGNELLTGAVRRVRQSGSTPDLQIGITSVINTLSLATLNNWFILRVDLLSASSSRARLYDIDSLVEESTDSAGSIIPTSAALEFGDAAIGADFAIAEFLGYPVVLSDANGDLVIAYLQQKYSGAAPATSGLTFNTGSAWLDNS